LHNDNEGVVRAYLNARWLHRLSQGPLSRRALRNILFATTYGQDVIRPSLLETAAWLALQNDEIAGEVSRRDPALLVRAGDPGSLTAARRAILLTRIVERIVRGERLPYVLDRDSVKRFACSGLSATIRSFG
jgi:hypothetical protein